MSINLRFPNITGIREADQINQIKSYLHQLVQELNWVLTNMESGKTPETNSQNQPATGLLSEETFQELKSLLIQSSSTLNSYYDKINGKLEGYYLKKDTFDAYRTEVLQRFQNLANQYVSKSDFETYQQSVAQILDGLADQYVAKADFDVYKQTNDQAIEGLLGEIEALRQMINDTNTGGE